MNHMQEESKTVLPPAADACEAVAFYGDMLFRLCFVLLRQRQDAEDAVQETFLRYLRKAPPFESREHEKAWLIRVATNLCKNMLRFRCAHAQLSTEEIQCYADSQEDTEILVALLSLPYIYKIVLQLYYVEGYKTAEIASMLHISLSAVKKRLEKGRKMLKSQLIKEDLL